ncbi:MAG: LicD family protein [Chlamydiota bacterium]
MYEKFWNYFVECLMAFFMPLVCSYYTLTADPFLNVSIQNASGLESAGNLLLSPFQYIFAGREAIETPQGGWELRQRFDYSHHFWLKTCSSLAALPLSALLGFTAKGLSFLDPHTKKRYESLKIFRNSTAICSQLETYKQLGLFIGDPNCAEFIQSEGYQRRPGDENYLAIEKNALQDIAAALDEKNICWWVDCGTCLGAYRYGGIIPWDYDIDIAVLLPDFDNVRRALSTLDSKKYAVQDWSSREHPDSYLKIFIRETGLMIDIYHFAINPISKEISYIFSLENNLFFPEWWKIRERRCKAPISFDAVFPLKKALFDGIEVWVPNDPKKFLQRYYGENLAPARVYDPKTCCYEKDLTHPYWQKAYAH